MTGRRTHYEVLGVPEGATTDEVRSAYRALARKLHPDARTGSDRERDDRAFSRISAAYGVLSVRASRRAYDEELARSRAISHERMIGSMRGGHLTWTNIGGHDGVHAGNPGVPEGKSGVEDEDGEGPDWGFDALYDVFYGGLAD